MITIPAGAKARSTVTFTPESGNTTIGNITARVTDAEGNLTTLTPVATGTTDQYKADIAVPDTAISGPWVVRWESSSPKIVLDDVFTVDASSAVNP